MTESRAAAQEGNSSAFDAKRVRSVNDLSHIRALSHQELATAVHTCTRAMRDNPLHCAVFGLAPDRRERKLRGFFSAVLPWMQRRGTLLALEGEPYGVIGVLPPGGCRPTPVETLRMLPTLSRRLTPLAAVRVARWLADWAKHDPAGPHWHLGPLAVDPLHQRLGIGSRLLRAALSRIDSASGTAYLETDTEANVAFYQRFGFVTVATARVVGVPNWFMQRKRPVPGTPDAPSRIVSPSA